MQLVHLAVEAIAQRLPGSGSVAGDVVDRQGVDGLQETGHAIAVVGLDHTADERAAEVHVHRHPVARRLVKPRQRAHLRATFFGDEVSTDPQLPSNNGELVSVGERPDGATVPRLVGKFRADFRLSLMMTTVRRAAAMQLGTGLPSCSVRGGVTLLPESTFFCGAERQAATEAEL
jgi:hypothetical protein